MALLSKTAGTGHENNIAVPIRPPGGLVLQRPIVGTKATITLKLTGVFRNMFKGAHMFFLSASSRAVLLQQRLLPFRGGCHTSTSSRGIS